VSGNRDAELLCALTRQVSRESLQHSTPDAMPSTRAATLTGAGVQYEVHPCPPMTPLMPKNGPKHDIAMTTLGGHRQEQLNEQVASTISQSLDT